MKSVDKKDQEPITQPAQPAEATSATTAPVNPEATAQGTEEVKEAPTPSTALAKNSTLAALAKVGNINEEQVLIIKRTIAKDISDAELGMFLMQCHAQGLNPLNREMWCFKDKDGRLLMFAGRDGFLVKAQRDPRYNGMRSAVIRAKDEYTIDVPNGRIEHRIKGDLAERGKPVLAYCIVYMRDRSTGTDLQVTIGLAEWETYNKPNSTAWKNYPDAMLLKVAESHAMKKACGMSGLEVEEDYYVHEGVAYPHVPTAAKEQPRNAELERKAEQIRLDIENYAGDDKEAIRAECMKRRSTGDFTEAFADSVLEKLHSYQIAR